VPALPAGAYTVKYRVLSVDGHVVEAELTFTVRGGS
jgi:methionine-rich copper-binding protein CopC